MGSLPDGRRVQCHVLGGEQLTLHVMELGAGVHRLRDHEGPGGDAGVDVVLGHATLDEYVAVRDYLGAVVGRLANRLGGASFELDGQVWTVPANEGENALHGGPDGFDRRLWTTTEVSGDSVTLALLSPHGDQGFPGALRVQVRYQVFGRTVTIDYRATTDRPTVVNLTNHAYFNLDGEGSGSVDEHTLTVPADTVTAVDDDGLPTGELRPVQGTPLDLRAGAELGWVVRQPDPLVVAADGLDHNFLPIGSGMRRVATLRAGRSGRALEVSSDLPGLQVYTGNSFDGSTVGHSGTPYRRGAGVALETQFFPDSPHHPAFPSVVLEPGDVWRSRTTWHVAVA